MSLVKIFLSIIAITLLTKCNVEDNSSIRDDVEIWKVQYVSELDSDIWSVELSDTNCFWYNKYAVGHQYTVYNKKLHQYYYLNTRDESDRKDKIYLAVYVPDYSPN